MIMTQQFIQVNTRVKEIQQLNPGGPDLRRWFEDVLSQIPLNSHKHSVLFVGKRHAMQTEIRRH